MEQLLDQWELPEETIALFVNNSIDISQLKEIHDNEAYLKELCPILGTRIKLKTNIAAYLEAHAPTESVTTNTNNEVDVANVDIEETGVIIVPPNHNDLSFTLSDICDISENRLPQTDFDLKTLLETSPCGKSVLQYYKTNHTLDSKRKNRLTDIIVNHLFTTIINKRLTLDDYNIITGKIITLFPQESAGTYFTKPIKKSQSGTGKSIPARGKLVDKVRNIVFQSTERKQHRTDSEKNKKKVVDSILLDLHQEDIDWLNNNHEPFEEVLSKWKSTQEVRHGRDYSDVHNFLEHWKILKNPRAAELINEDFSFLYEGKEENFNLYWNTFIENFIQIKRHEIAKDETKEALLNSMYDLDEENKIPTQINLLVSVVPPKGRISKKAKCSTQECLDSILRIVDNAGDINTTIEKEKQKALKEKRQVQPYLILQGNLTNIHRLYLVIDALMYSFHSVKRAFDILFKCYHVLNAKYPKASAHIHLIIQRCVYKITTKYDNPVPYISEILNLA